MTSPSRGFHPTTDSISDLLEGLLPPEEGRATAEHLGDCAQCLAVRAALVRTHDVLQTAGRTPPPIPPDVFASVEAGLRAESQARTQTTGVVSLAAAREKRSTGWKTKVLGVAAALALLGGAGAVALQVMTPEENLAGDPTGPSQTEDAAPGPGDAPAGESPPALKAAEFDQGVRALLKGGPVIKPGDPGAVADDPLADLHPSQVSCVSNLLTQEGAWRVLAAEESTLDGTQVILVVTDTTEVDTVHGYAISGCDSDTPKILHDEAVSTN